ncbi:type II secretion system minor pseudopilin GspI [Pseudomaricurvus alcaniphilus]|uniref:type II secretion system minor pseudopilin GspI n=1 Tax=Pseudomaricurvus alcaniphilus TaxID=1166482 RepID=UPI00140DDD1B|nr:type II secretion system minor pseudopilin GspI [Pseudomaricurvus alcaniphilus]
MTCANRTQYHNRGTKGSRRRAGGFTLVEVLVALFVIGVAIPALLSLVMGQVDGTGILRQKMVAHWVVENRLTQLRLQKAVTQQVFKGKASGIEAMAGSEWQWQVESTPTEVSGLLRYDITVGTREQAALVSLTAFVDE